LAQYVTGKEKFRSSTLTGDEGNQDHHQNWIQVKGEWNQYIETGKKFALGLDAEMLLSSKNLMSNYTASILQAPAFTPTPHSKVVFNEAFRANQYLAAGISPVINITKMLQFRMDLYGFAPLFKIEREEINENGIYFGKPYYGKFMRSFEYMGETALVLQLPFACISLYANGYSKPSKNFNFGLNIGYLIFNPKMID
jgi:NTE family protein